MSDEDKKKGAAETVKAIVEAVPIYQDALQPAAKEIGTGLHTVAKTINVALSPFKVLVWGYDKIEDYVISSLAERFKNVPAERLIAPSPTVAGPTLEALRFAGHEPSLRELYANLLATSMDAKTAQQAHPAFVEIIRQLTPDEARILKLFSLKRVYPVISLVSSKIDSIEYKSILEHFSLLGEEAKCSYPDLTQYYLDNLCRLGLAEIKEDMWLVEAGVYEPLENTASIVKLVSAINKHENRKCEIKKEILSVSNLGKQFCIACVVQPDRS